MTRTEPVLWALALVEAVTEGNQPNVSAVLDETFRDDECVQRVEAMGELLYGLVALSRSLLMSAAAASGVSLTERVEVERAMLLEAVQP